MLRFAAKIYVEHYSGLNMMYDLHYSALESVIMKLDINLLKQNNILGLV